LKVGLTIDAAGTLDEFFTLLDTLNDYEIKTTFFCGVRIQPAILKSIYEKGHEIGSHTYSHAASYSSLSFEEKELDIRIGHIWLIDALGRYSKDASIKGFRVPFYNFDTDIPLILEELKYSWDSSKAYFPILNSRFKPERYGGVIELPSIHPDDHTLLRRIGLSEKQVLRTWMKCLELSEDIFIWGIHPYICMENDNRIEMLRTFIEHVLENEGEFLTLSEIADEVKLDLTYT
jgi:peptidoglycan/xylan/chitin deacetylase (PgdA/CDA1 family)